MTGHRAERDSTHCRYCGAHPSQWHHPCTDRVTGRERDRKLDYGPWERADDVPPVLRVSSVHGSALLSFAYRRKVYEIWQEGDRKMGRWTWEYAA